ncbi:MAG: hypothetical protein A4E35_00261 [Methanoregula sp. PtaU1.Bin051]|nr:MAG: hypothetical protein A4E35_00261 [Methanoregula sp. PtaU1.Bin051]
MVMNIIEESVKKLEEAIHDTGCDDGAVTLRRNPDAVNCQYERGACMESCYGGRTGEFVTSDPVEATTKISFMFGAELTRPQAKSAACAILNVLTVFLCMSRGVRACQKPAHRPCLTELKEKITGKRVYSVEPIPVLGYELGSSVAPDPQSADIILINNEGLVNEQVSEIIREYRGKKEILCIGPSTSGVAGLERLERFCPYGT